jgi:cell division protein ZipA
LPEFRWILLGLGLLLIAGIWWWGSRRSAQAPGNAELRETTAKEPPRQETAEQDMGPQVQMHEWEMSPFEPLTIKTADFDQVDVGTRAPGPQYSDDAETVPKGFGPVMPPLLSNAVPIPVKAVPIPAKAPVEAPPQPAAVMPADTPAVMPATESSDRIATQAPRKPNASEKQKIVTVRVCAPAETPWPGSALLSALELHGLAYGRYQVFHRRHVDGRSLFCVASLVEPGTFDVAQMPNQEFKGVTLFAVLPGPVDALLTVDEMLSAARGLAGELPGMVQDAKGAALSPQRLAALRDDIALFQATLPVS